MSTHAARRLPRLAALLLGVLGACVLALQLGAAQLLSVVQSSPPPGDDPKQGGGGDSNGGDDGDGGGGELEAQPAPSTLLLPSWQAAIAMVRASPRRYIIVDVKNGLGNRLRALASAMALAGALRRPVLLVWVPDLHCNCGIGKLFAQPYPFALLEEELPREGVAALEDVQVYNYMRPEPGAVKDERVRVNESRHLYFRSAFLMNHPTASWRQAQRQLQRLAPSERVRALLSTDKSMVGLHVRNVFDAPRDAASNASTVGKAAVDGATKE